MIKLEAAQRILADIKERTWFDGLSKEEQKEYVEKHPHSKYAEDYDNARDAEPDDNGDKERISQLKMQIKYLTQDIAELKEEGEDYSRERKELESLKQELRDLQ
jgi:hypothetical protein